MKTAPKEESIRACSNDTRGTRESLGGGKVVPGRKLRQCCQQLESTSHSNKL